MICQQQFSVWVVLPTQEVEALDTLGIACRREQLAGFSDGGGRGGLVTKPLAIPISAMSCLGRYSAPGVDRIAACSLPRRSNRSSPSIHTTAPACGAGAESHGRAGDDGTQE